MNINDYFKRPDSISMVDMAAKLKINVDMLRHWRYGHAGRKATAHAAVSMEFYSNGKIRVEHVRPDLAWRRMKDPRWVVATGQPMLDLWRSNRKASRSAGV